MGLDRSFLVHDTLQFADCARSFRIGLVYLGILRRHLGPARCCGGDIGFDLLALFVELATK